MSLGPLPRAIARLSLHARLLLIAAVTTAIALLFAAASIGHVLERVVMRGLDETLDTQIAILAAAIPADGRLDRARVVALPGFTRRAHGWTWAVRTPAGVWRGTGAPLAIARIAPPHGPHDRRGDDGIRPGEGRTASGEPMHLRRLRYAVAAGPVEIVAAAPRALVDRPLRSALAPLLASLALLGGGLALATWVQLRIGLRPLRTLRTAVAHVRTGGQARLPDDQPRELQPLVDEVNALIDQNAAGLEHARRHVANLAHGLKTPLATLALKLEADRAPDATRALVAELDQRIAHHLRRARSAAPGGGTRARTSITTTAADLLDALRHVHADRALAFDARIDPQLIAAVERQDLDEILGNLLDNGCRHARGRVRIAAAADAAMIAIAIADDGPGLDDAALHQALRPGERLDESGVGYGFGLSIVAELAELYGGGLTLRRSAELGGLHAQVTLPRAADGA